MKKQFIILLGILAFWVTSCQNNDFDMDDSINSSAEGSPVNVFYSFSKSLQTGTEQVPMQSDGQIRAGEGEVKAIISNRIKVLLAKEVNGQWILDDLITYKIDPTVDLWTLLYHDVCDTTQFDPIPLTLRPGKYKITLISGERSLTWNSTLKKGVLLPEGQSAPWLCTYTRATDFQNIGWPELTEEIFAGSGEFEVKKTEDLHSTVHDNNVSLTMKRKVAKLRFLLKKRTETNPGANADRSIPERINWDDDVNQDFLVSYQLGITAKLDLADPNQTFCSGLNIWGEAQRTYYLNDQYKKTLRFGVYAWRNFYLGNDGQQYTLGMKRNTNQCNQFFFTGDNEDLPLKISEIRVSAFSGGPVYVYDGTVEGVSLKSNSITGTIFKSGNAAWEVERWQGSAVSIDYYRELLLVEEGGLPAKSEDKFNNYYEVRERKPGENN